MIEVKKIDGEFNILVDGEVLNKTSVRAEVSEEDYRFRIYIKNSSSSKKILPYKITEISDFKLISFQLGSNNIRRKRVTIVREDLRDGGLDDRYKVSINMSTNNQRDGFSFVPYCEELEKVIAKSNEKNTNPIAWFSRTRNRNVEISFVHLPLSLAIGEEINNLLEIINEFHTKTIKALKRKNDANLKSIVTSFNFPEEIKVSCEQYLLYFAQFLKDLGINVTSHMKEKAGKVLFSVMPTDDIEALDKIRQALAVYLSLPSSPIVYDESFKAMRLEQQIENLKHSQKMKEREIRSAERVIMIQDEIIREKDEIISQKGSIINQQNRIIEKITNESIMVDSLENKEEIFDGLKVGESEFLAKQAGVHFNPVTSLKALGKKILGKEEIISILDSGEETDKK